MINKRFIEISVYNHDELMYKKKNSLLSKETSYLTQERKDTSPYFFKYVRRNGSSDCICKYLE